MAFKDLGDWAELGGLKLPIGGKVYSVPPVSAELGPRIQVVVSASVDVARGNQVNDGDQKVLGDLDEQTLYRDVLGATYEEIVADKVPWPAIKHAAITVMIDSATDRATAERFWQSLGKPAPARKKPADRLAPKDPKVTEIRTRRASTAGTTSRRTPAARASRGKPSSSTGS